MANGLYTNSELVDSLIVDLNALPLKLMEGQYIQACSIVSAMGQKLSNLRDGIKADIDGKNRVIEELKEQLRASGSVVEDHTPEELFWIKGQGEK